jgi:hypothetical protein
MRALGLISVLLLLATASVHGRLDAESRQGHNQEFDFGGMVSMILLLPSTQGGRERELHMQTTYTGRPFLIARTMLSSWGGTFDFPSPSLHLLTFPPPHGHSGFIFN